MRKYIIFLVIAITLLFPSIANAAGDETVTVEGTVVNGTDNGSSVADLDVTLYLYQGANEMESLTVKSDGSGYFVFDDLDTDTFDSCIVSTVFGEAEYYSDLLSFGEGEASKSADITVYDSTTSDEAIIIAMAHTIVYFGEENLEIKEYVLFMNTGDRTYVGANTALPVNQRETLRFSLPGGATDLSPSIGLIDYYITSTDEGFSYSLPVIPGASEVAYSYTIASYPDEYDFSERIFYPMSRYDLLLEGENVRAENTNLAEDEPLEISGVQYTHLASENLVPGSIVTARLSNSPGGGNQTATVLISAGIGLLVIALLGFSVWKRRKPRADEKPAAAEADDTDRRRQELLLEIAGLDDDFADGKIDEDDYRKLREEKKTEITALMSEAKK